MDPPLNRKHPQSREKCKDFVRARPGSSGSRKRGPIMNVLAIARYWERLSFRLPALIVVFAATAGLVSGAISYAVAHQSYIALAKERMAQVRNERSRAVLALVERYRAGLGSLVVESGIAENLEG